MTARLYGSGHLNATSAIQDCDHENCGWVGPLKGLPHCSRCQRHHAPDVLHSGQCHSPGCIADAIDYAKPGRKPHFGMYCAAHSVEDGDRIEERDRNGRFLELSAELADLMPKAEPLAHLDDEGADFIAWSNSKACFYWPMVWTPEGYAVHVGEGCIGEQKRGVLGCHHSRQEEKPWR